MGTSLTGLTPSTTYDALIKVGDNGALSATAKVLSDGLGNDSPISMSTTLVGVGTATPLTKLQVAEDIAYSASTTGQLFVGGATNTGKRLMLGYDTTNNFGFLEGVNFGVTYSNICLNPTSGNVGIGTTNLGGKFQVKVVTDANIAFNDVGGVSRISCFDDAIAVSKPLIISGQSIRFTPSGTEIARFTTDGLTFNGDTAAANALDDYEEGTFTATLTPNISGSITTSSTFNTWTYTKIGRQVTVNGVFVVSSVSSPNGVLIIGGLPFTILNNNGAYGAFSCNYYTSTTTLNAQLPAQHVVNTTQLIINKVASTVAANDEMYVTATYFV
jgi:hypothetical protein